MHVVGSVPVKHEERGVGDTVPGDQEWSGDSNLHYCKLVGLPTVTSQESSASKRKKTPSQLRRDQMRADFGK